MPRQRNYSSTKTCSICGETKSIFEFYVRPERAKGPDCASSRMSKCKHCERKYINARNDANRDEVRAASRRLSRTTAGRFRKLKKIARQRGFEVEIAFSDYAQLVAANKCHWCDGPLPEAGGGIDRLNSNLGYTWSNCVPSCKICNQMKNDLSVNEFIVHMKKILAKHAPVKHIFSDRFWAGWKKDQESRLFVM
jgi:hypothetical protein